MPPAFPCAHYLPYAQYALLRSESATLSGYEIREPVEVRITREDLLVLSFPGPDRSIKLDELRQGRAVSRRYRNRRIGEFLKELDLTEGRSTGISKILKAMTANGSPPPEFETDDERSHFIIRLPVHPLATAIPPAISETSENTSGETGVKTRVKTRVRILDLISATPEISATELAAHLGLTAKGVEWHLTKLKQEKRLRRIGPAKGGHWEVLPPPAS